MCGSDARLALAPGEQDEQRDGEGDGAVGRPEFIRADFIKDGAVVVDAGYHPGGVGDIELGPLAERASAITPVPGGVGPMTINTLIQQTVESGEKALG